MPINRFRGQYFFLSNFYPCPCGVEFEGDVYDTTEHAYQAAKIEDRAGRDSFTRGGSLGENPMDAKMKGKNVKMRPGWASLKTSVMLQVVRSKFENSSVLAQKLVNTGSQTIVEGHTGDKFWGGKANHLGNILMRVRKELRDGIAANVPLLSDDFAEDESKITCRKDKGKSVVVRIVRADVDSEDVFFPDRTTTVADLLDDWLNKHNESEQHFKFMLSNGTAHQGEANPALRLLDYASGGSLTIEACYVAADAFVMYGSDDVATVSSVIDPVVQVADTLAEDVVDMPIASEYGLALQTMYMWVQSELAQRLDESDADALYAGLQAILDDIAEPCRDACETEAEEACLNAMIILKGDERLEDVSSQFETWWQNMRNRFM